MTAEAGLEARVIGVLRLLHGVSNVLFAMTFFLSIVQTIFFFVGLSENRQLGDQSAATESKFHNYSMSVLHIPENVFLGGSTCFCCPNFGLRRHLYWSLALCVRSALLLLVVRSNLLAARKGAFKIDAAISDYRAFSFIGNQIACSLLGFLIVVVLFTAVSFCLIYSTVRELILAKILAALPVIIFASIQAVIA